MCNLDFKNRICKVFKYLLKRKNVRSELGNLFELRQKEAKTGHDNRKSTGGKSGLQRFEERSPLNSEHSYQYPDLQEMLAVA